MARLAVDLAGLHLASPVLSASGTFGHGLEMRHFVGPDALGAWVSKTVTRRPRPGNPMPRIAETEAGFLNSIGLENRGVEAYIARTLPEFAGAGARIVTNVGGESADDFAAIVERLDTCPEIDAFEVNLSCPNVDGGKLPFSTVPEVTERVIRAVRAATDKPVLAKLSPNVTRIDEIAQAAEAGGADGITAVNTVLGMAVDWRARRPRLATGVGGYSGTAIKPIALRCAHECARAVSIPVVGCGGISCAEDVLEFLVVGCRAVQVGTASFSDPSLLAGLVRRVDDLLESAGVEDVNDLIGTLAPRSSARAGAGDRAGHAGAATRGGHGRGEARPAR